MKIYFMKSLLTCMNGAILTWGFSFAAFNLKYFLSRFFLLIFAAHLLYGLWTWSAFFIYSFRILFFDLKSWSSSKLLQVRRLYGDGIG